ncbi:2-hydroxyacid dehydrogenase [Salipiger sp. IMCC34102]|uniref:2-hydroxyacid dehydrogenase n=1 Tax=Salipiger sp. IMCC34102 TaxID=2510647 RepID=UPI00101C1895|nr:2-hydroxyacid dehydrogenase [Salipiger sp. IMCC34102]RYH02549.1 2-hydroxyacid dehydrogenase [Salipiger sp. IMCC34102]
MSKPDILVMYPTRPHAMAKLQDAYTLHRYDEARDREAFLAEHGPKCRGVVTNGHAALTRDMLDHLPNCEIVACASAGFESIDVAALADHGIAFTNTSAALYDDVADAALMLTLAARRELVQAHAYVQTGAWGEKGPYPLLSSLAGKRAGILGFGTIGAAIAERFAPLKLTIGYTARSKKDVAHRYFADPMDLADWADILVVIVPGGAETDGMVDAAMLAALGPTGTLVNVARGSVVDEAALIDALEAGKLGSAGLDVYRDEPQPDPRLTGLPNVTLYPHHASGTVETRDAMAQLVVENLAAHFEGRSLLTPVSAPA